MMCLSVIIKHYIKTFIRKSMALESFLSTGNIFFILIILLLTILWLRSRRPSDFPPGPTPWPILGNLLTIHGRDIMDVVDGFHKKYGELFSLSLGSHWVVHVNGSRALKEVFVKNCDTLSDRPDVWYLTYVKKKKGLAAAYPWKEQRSFALNLLRELGFGKSSMESRIAMEVDHFITFLDQQKGEAVVLSGSINKAVSNVICSIVLGSRFDYTDDEFCKFVRTITETAVFKFVPLVNMMPSLRFLPGIKDKCEHIENQNEKTREWFQGHIDKHKATLDDKNIQDFIDAYLVKIKRIKTDPNSQFTEDNLKSVVLDLFTAGTETTSNTITWCVLFLLNYPDVQEKMRAELLENMPKGPPTLSERHKLPYCEAVITETQRLGNVLPYALPHTASTDTYVFGQKIPKGAIVVPNLNSVMHDETVFPDSYNFDPGRFLDEEGNFCNQENILAFSLGKRVCLGEGVARMELFLFLTSMVYRYNILPPEDNLVPPIIGKLGLTREAIPFKVRFMEYR